MVQLQIGPTAPLLHRSLISYDATWHHNIAPTQIRIYETHRAYDGRLVVAYDAAFNKLFRVTWDGFYLREVSDDKHTRYMF